MGIPVCCRALYAVQARSQVPRRSRSFTSSPTSQTPASATFNRSNLSNPSAHVSNPSASFSSPSARSSAPPTPASKAHMGQVDGGRADSSSSLDTTAAIQGSPSEPRQTPTSRPRQATNPYTLPLTRTLACAFQDALCRLQYQCEDIVTAGTKGLVQSLCRAAFKNTFSLIFT